MLTLRAATEADQAAITRIIHEAQINPRELDWHHFLVVADDQQLIGVGQVKPHPDGSRELASLAVAPAWQGRKIGDALMYALLAREDGPLHLMCLSHMQPYYERFGFQRINPRDFPRYYQRMRPFFLLLNIMLRFRGISGTVRVMRRAVGPAHRGSGS